MAIGDFVKQSGIWRNRSDPAYNPATDNDLDAAVVGGWDSKLWELDRATSALGVSPTTRLTDCRGVMVGSNISRSGPPADGVVDGINGWAPNERIFLTAQTNAWNNGPWLVQTGSWTRPADYPVGGVTHGMYAKILEGTNYAKSVWILKTPDPITYSGPNVITDTPTLWIPLPGDLPTIGGGGGGSGKQIIAMRREGLQTEGTGPAIPAPFAFTLTDLEARLDVAPLVTGTSPTGDLVVHILKNGVNVRTITFVPGDSSETATGLSVAYARGDTYALRINQQDSGVTASGISVALGVVF